MIKSTGAGATSREGFMILLMDDYMTVIYKGMSSWRRCGKSYGAD